MKDIVSIINDISNSVYLIGIMISVFIISVYRFITTEKNVKDIEKNVSKIDNDVQNLKTTLVLKINDISDKLKDGDTTNEIAALKNTQLQIDVTEIKVSVNKILEHQIKQSERITILETEYSNIKNTTKK